MLHKVEHPEVHPEPHNQVVEVALHRVVLLGVLHIQVVGVRLLVGVHNLAVVGLHRVVLLGVLHIQVVEVPHNQSEWGCHIDQGLQAGVHNQVVEEDIQAVGVGLLVGVHNLVVEVALHRVVLLGVLHIQVAVGHHNQAE